MWQSSIPQLLSHFHPLPLFHPTVIEVTRSKTMASSRQKSCGECSKAKRRCDLKMPCLRCTQRGLACLYANLPPQPVDTPSINNHERQNVTHIFHQESPDELSGANFVLDPALATRLSDLPSADVDLDLTAWESTLPEGQCANSNKLRMEEILRTGADYRRADYHKAYTEWVRSRGHVDSCIILMLA